jgi:hypothetical protein
MLNNTTSDMETAQINPMYRKSITKADGLVSPATETGEAST